ncbi:MAG: type II and III secretion system protein family protein [Hyphomicrobiales bacterium]|nr:type II and III secretion system protein family protein [Hyphomicrobiales bacterium]
MKHLTKHEGGRAQPIVAARGAGRICSVALSVAAASVVAMAWLMPFAVAPAQARVIELDSGSRSVAITVPVGKSDNVHTEGSFSDVVVADPETADVVPLTDHSVSILGKKIGATRVSLYGEGKKLVGLVDVEVAYDMVRLGAAISRQFPHARINVSSLNGRLMLSGSAPDGVTVDKVMTFAKQFGPDVVNAMQVSQPQQVMLAVRFMEVSRTASRELGIQWNVVAQNINATVGPSTLLSGNTPFASIAANVLKGNTNVNALIQALEQRQVARTLAEPNLVALSGDTANFLAGGEFPFPVAAQLGLVTIEWKRFGVGLAFTPTVLGDGLINLKIEPEVSQLDPTNVVQVGGVAVPSLIVRRANTTVELRDGQSFAMAGLLQNISNANLEQLPWLADVPVIGALMRSTQYKKKETDLVIIVTPHLVQPARPGDPLRTPTDEAVAGNDGDLFLLGRAEVTKPERRALAVVPRPLTGHMLNLAVEAPYAAR